jgi:hypothetical protein
MTAVPRRTLRHFAEPPAAGLDRPEVRGLVVARLLEDGDRDDLAWLAARYAPGELADWVSRHGLRRLSRRSRALWFAALGLGTAPRSAAAEALWPLA